MENSINNEPRRRSQRAVNKSPKYIDDLPLSPNYEPSPAPAERYQINSPDFIPENVCFENTNAYIDHMLPKVEDNLS